MRLSLSLLLAASVAMAAQAATRPHYGGALRVEMRDSIGALDPAQPNQSSAQERMEALVFESLVTFDDSGTAQPKVASGWQHSADYKHWEFEIRAGVKFQNGQSLTSTLAAESLRRSLGLPGTRIVAESGHLTFESETPMTNLLAELAKARNAIVVRTATGLSGTGPFKVESASGGKIILVANDDHWDGRPYLDEIDLVTARAPRDQLVDFELGRADVIEVEPEEARQAQAAGARVASSEPSELLAVVFNPASNRARDERVRRALALSIDRASICNVLLQHQAEPAAALLPQWMTGYAFLFPSGRDVEQAQEQQVRISSLILDYDFADTLAKAVAERIAVNAREAGIMVQPVGENLGARAGNGDAALVRVHMGSVDARTALENSATALSLALPEELQRAHTPEQFYRVERTMLADHKVIPIAHLRESHGLSERVKDWGETPVGGWRLEDVWPSAGTAIAEGRP